MKNSPIKILNSNIKISLASFVFWIGYFISISGNHPRKGEILVLWIIISILYWMFLHHKENS